MELLADKIVTVTWLCWPWVGGCSPHLLTSPPPVSDRLFFVVVCIARSILSVIIGFAFQRVFNQFQHHTQTHKTVSDFICPKNYAKTQHTVKGFTVGIKHFACSVQTIFIKLDCLGLCEILRAITQAQALIRRNTMTSRKQTGESGPGYKEFVPLKRFQVVLKIHCSV